MLCQMLHNDTRGNVYKSVPKRCIYDVRKYFLLIELLNIWNSLPVVAVNSVSTFKKHLDKFWVNIDVYYNYKAKIQCRKYYILLQQHYWSLLYNFFKCVLSTSVGNRGLWPASVILIGLDELDGAAVTGPSGTWLIYCPDIFFTIRYYRGTR